MKTISNREFCANPDLYMGVAAEQEVRIRKGRQVFSLIRETDDDEATQNAIGRYLDAVYPDGMPPLGTDEEEIANAISIDEFLRRFDKRLDEKWAERRK